MEREEVLEAQIKFLRAENARLEEGRQRMKVIIKQLFEELLLYIDRKDQFLDI